MLKLLQKRTHYELEGLVTKTVNSMQNNYKDMAQDYFKKFSELLDKLLLENGLNDKQKAYYSQKRDELFEELKGFTHKDQKPFW